MSQFRILPPGKKRRITACVGFVARKGQPNEFLAIKNKRGWDIPGGHVEPGEVPLETFKRELLEETGCTLLPGASTIAILESKKQPQTGIAVYRGLCRLGSFTPNSEIEDRRFLSSSELLKSYFGDKNLLKELISLL